MNKTKNKIEAQTILNIFAVKNGKLKILLQRREEEPYKGYWQLPEKKLENKTLEENIENMTSEIIDSTNLFIDQERTFLNIENTNETLISISYICIINDDKTEKENWFSIDEIPKMAYNHKEIIESAIEKLKTKLVNSNILKKIFPSEFTLPEIQTVFESILNVKLDRRNFRKKFINLGLIEEKGYNNAGRSGRPAKLYKFKENVREKNLF